MEKAIVRYAELTGTNYEIGYQLGKQTAAVPQCSEMQKCQAGTFTEKQVAEMTAMFDAYCPGLNEELQGFSDALEFPREQLIFCAMTYLLPGCSQIAVLPSLSADGHVRLIRNTDFSHRFEDFTFFKTKVSGRYAHMGSSVVQLGRGEGLNEYGLAISQTSCGLPVGSGISGLLKPTVVGLQYWAVIRSLLENCKTVKDAQEFLRDMPIAYNLNLMLTDKSGTAVLFETMDGKKASCHIDATSEQQYLHSTNHAHLSEFVSPQVMEHSAVRYEYIKNYMNKAMKLTEDDLKELLLSRYPQGLGCGWYNEFFGTTKSMVFDVTLGKVDICWGGLAENGWHTYFLSDYLMPRQQEISIILQEPTANIFGMVENRN